MVAYIRPFHLLGSFVPRFYEFIGNFLSTIAFYYVVAATLQVITTCVYDDTQCYCRNAQEENQEKSE